MTEATPRLGIVTLFPDELRAMLEVGVTGRAIVDAKVAATLVNPRDFAGNVHRSVDDRPYGGGPGMVMTLGPLRRAVAAAKNEVGGNARVLLMSPQGRRFDQAAAASLAAQLQEGTGIVLVCGRYEGIDERFAADVDEEWSLGDFVLSGGEIAALAVTDAVLRLMPKVLGDPESAENDSFGDGLLDCPHYTRPEQVAGQRVPAVLLGGDHAQIARWRRKQALGRTARRRPELLEKRQLSAEEQELLEEFFTELGETE